MKRIKHSALIICALVFGTGIVKGQQRQALALDPVLYHVFDADSLRGFDEEAARRSAIDERFTGPEFPVRMYQLKRRYINDKYNLVPAQHQHKESLSYIQDMYGRTSL